MEAAEAWLVLPGQEEPKKVATQFQTPQSIFVLGHHGLRFDTSVRLIVSEHPRLAKVALVSEDPKGALLVFRPDNPWEEVTGAQEGLEEYVPPEVEAFASEEPTNPGAETLETR